MAIRRLTLCEFSGVLSVLNASSLVAKFTTAWSGSSSSVLFVQLLRGPLRGNGLTAGSAISSMSCPSSQWIPEIEIRSSFPVIFNGTGNIPPATAVNYVTWGIVGFIFQYVIRRRHFSWWTKYNCMYHPDSDIIRTHLFLLLHTHRRSFRRTRHWTCMFDYPYFLLSSIPR